MSDYSGWFRSVPADDRPDWAQRQVVDADNRARWEAWALKRLRMLQDAVPVKEGRRTPCIAIGVMVDDNGRRYPMIAMSGDGALPEAVANMLDPRERAAGIDEENLHAEQRLVRQAEAIRAENAEREKLGLPVAYPGLRLESVAAAYPICWRRCQPELAREGTRALTPLQSPPPDQEPSNRPPTPPSGVAYDPSSTRSTRRGPRK